jgi:tetratricopeptide (TPR) repeat protein
VLVLVIGIACVALVASGPSQPSAGASGSPDDVLRASWRRRVAMQTALLAVTPDPAAQEVRETLLGLYGSLGEWRKAREINVQMLAKADPGSRTELLCNLAELDEAILAESPDRAASDADYLASAQAAVAALTPPADDRMRRALVRQLLQRGEHRASRADFAPAAEDFALAHACATAITTPSASAVDAATAPAAVLDQALESFQAPAAETYWQRFAPLLQALHDPGHTFGTAVLRRFQGNVQLDTPAFRAAAESALAAADDAGAWELRFSLADSYHDAADYGKAVEHYLVLTRLDPDPVSSRRRSMLPMLYGGLGSSFDHLGDGEQAVRWYAKLLEEHPNDPFAEAARAVIAKYRK